MSGLVPPRARHLAAAPFDVRIQPDREAVRVVPVGELDLATVDQLHASVEELVAVGFERVVVDLRELVFIDCAGLRLLRALHRGAGEDGWQLVLIQGSAVVRRLFAMTGTLDELEFQVSPSPRRVPHAVGLSTGRRSGGRACRPRSQH